VALYFAVRETKKNRDGESVDSAVYVLIQEPTFYSDLERIRHEEFEQKREELDRIKLDRMINSNPFTDPANSSDSTEKELESSLSELEKEVSPFTISANIIYEPPHFSPRIRAQDSVLLACYNPLAALEEKDYLEIAIQSSAHDEIRRRLDLYGVFHKQLFPDLDGMAKWLKFHEFECQDRGGAA
jgi:hypothetical protein